MRDVLAQLEAANARTDTAMARLEAARAEAAAFDEAACRARTRAALLADPGIDWDALSAVLTGWQCGSD